MTKREAISEISLLVTNINVIEGFMRTSDNDQIEIEASYRRIDELSRIIEGMDTSIPDNRLA